MRKLKNFSIPEGLRTLFLNSPALVGFGTDVRRRRLALLRAPRTSTIVVIVATRLFIGGDCR